MSDPVPAVAVVLPVYNGEAFLDETVASVLAQTADDLELIIIDDGSQDGSLDLARVWAGRDPRVRVLCHPGGTNRGVSATRNLGASSTRAEFLAFIDGDDVWLPGKLAHQLAVFERHPEVGLVGGAACYWDSWRGGKDWIVVAGHRPDTVVPVFEAACQTYPLGQAQAPCPSTLMVRRSLFEQLGGFEAQFEGIYQLYEDQAFLAKCYTAAPVFMASETYCRYRQHDSSIVASVMKDGRYHEVRRFFLEWLQAYLGTHDLHHPQLDAKLRRARLRYGNPVERGFAWLLDRGK